MNGSIGGATGKEVATAQSLVTKILNEPMKRDKVHSLFVESFVMLDQTGASALTAHDRTVLRNILQLTLNNYSMLKMGEDDGK